MPAYGLFDVSDDVCKNGSKNFLVKRPILGRFSNLFFEKESKCSK